MFITQKSFSRWLSCRNFPVRRHVPEFMTPISSLRIYLNISSMLVLYEGWKSAARICEACRSPRKPANPSSKIIFSASKRDERKEYI